MQLLIQPEGREGMIRYPSDAAIIPVRASIADPLGCRVVPTPKNQKSFPWLCIAFICMGQDAATKINTRVQHLGDNWLPVPGWMSPEFQIPMLRIKVKSREIKSCTALNPYGQVREEHETLLSSILWRL